MHLRVVDDFDEFVGDATRRLQRALVAQYGVELGREAAADAIAYAWEHRDDLAAKANPIGYLFRVGQTSVRRLRRQRRLIDLPPESRADSYRVVDGEPSLPAALSRLTDAQRAAVLLVHAHAYSYAEAAELLDIPVTTLRNHIHRGMTRLRALLEQP
jgi:DNA-directed RNA polymerase specialized sigma24 family protein